MTIERRKTDREAEELPEEGETTGEEKKAAATTLQPRAYPDLIDDTLDDSFPASDPPQWWGR